MDQSENQKGRDHSKNLILKWISGKQDGKCGLDSVGTGQGSVRSLVNTVMKLGVP
jgi:hypothetical protein